MRIPTSLLVKAPYFIGGSLAFGGSNYLSYKCGKKGSLPSIKEICSDIKTPFVIAKAILVALATGTAALTLGGLGAHFATSSMTRIQAKELVLAIPPGAAACFLTLQAIKVSTAGIDEIRRTFPSQT